MDKKIIFLFLFLFSFSLASAQPPFQTSSDTQVGVIVEVPVIEYHKANEDFKFHMHAYNSSDGTRFTNDTISCMIHLYRPSDGGHLIEDYLEFDNNGIDFEYTALAGNFTEIGQYAVLFDCQDTTLGGFFEHSFEVTHNGQAPTSPNVIIFFSTLFLLIIMFGIYSLMNVLALAVQLEADIIDVAKNVGAYVAVFALYALSLQYMGNVMIEDILLTIINFGWITHVVVPLIAFATSLIMNPLRGQNGQSP